MKLAVIGAGGLCTPLLLRAVAGGALAVSSADAERKALCAEEFELIHLTQN